jgi:hypothetical protein
MRDGSGWVGGLRPDWSAGCRLREVAVSLVGGTYTRADATGSLFCA